MLKFPDIDPFLIQFGSSSYGIRWYGLMYVIGFVFAWWLARRRSTRPDSPVTGPQVDDLIFYGMLGVILGGRVGSVLVYGWSSFVADPLYLLRVWEGGMSFHGGLVGVLLAMYLYGRSLGMSMWRITDFVAPVAPIGLGLGRIGNFINGELWGAPSELPWAMQVRCIGQRALDLCSRKLNLPVGTEMTPPLHPSMLYEALLEGLLLFVIVWFYSARPRPYMAVSGLFLFCYGVFRFFVEFYRVPDAHLGYLALGWVTMGQILSAPMIAVGAVMLVLAYVSKKSREAGA